MPPIEASIMTIGNGGALELFDRELARVLANIKDVNTDPKKRRKISLNFQFDPHPDRSGAQCIITVETKMPSVNGVAGSIYIGRQGNNFRAFTQDIRQGGLFDEDQSGDEAEEPKPRNVTKDMM